MQHKHLLTPLILILLLATPALANVNYTEEYCQDNTTLVKHHFYDNGTANITTKKEYTQPYYGCRNGSAVQPGGTLQGIQTQGLLFGILIFMSIAMIGVLRKQKHQSLKIGFYMLALTLGTTLALHASGLLQTYTEITKLQSIGHILGTVGYAMAMVTLLVFFYFIASVAFRLLDFFGEGETDKDNYEEMR